MSISFRRRLLACGAFLAVAVPVEAKGAGEPEHVALTYVAPPECPQEAAFVAAVDARRRGAPQGEATPPRGGRTFDVVIERLGEARFRGTLRIRDGADLRERTAEESRCDGIVRVLAVFTALAIDVDAAPAPAPPPAPKPASPPLPPADPPTVPPDVEPLPSSSLEIRSVPSMVRVGVSLGFRKDLSSGGGLTAAVDLSRERPNGWAPAMRIGGVMATSGWSSGEGFLGQPSSTGSTRLRAGFVDLCPLRYDLVDLYAQSCFRGELGTFDLTIDEGDLSTLPSSGTWQPSKDRPWASVGATAGLRANLGRYFFLDFEAGLSVPLTNVRIDDSNGQPVYSTSVATWLGLGFGGYLVAIKIPSDAH